MPSQPTKPVDNPLSKVNDEIDVGADLEFQQRWWRFEKAIWSVFTALIAIDLVGAFGRAIPGCHARFGVGGDGRENSGDALMFTVVYAVIGYFYLLLTMR